MRLEGIIRHALEELDSSHNTRAQELVRATTHTLDKECGALWSKLTTLDEELLVTELERANAGEECSLAQALIGVQEELKTATMEDLQSKNGTLASDSSVQAALKPLVQQRIEWLTDGLLERSKALTWCCTLVLRHVARGGMQRARQECGYAQGSDVDRCVLGVGATLGERTARPLVGAVLKAVPRMLRPRAEVERGASGNARVAAVPGLVRADTQTVRQTVAGRLDLVPAQGSERLVAGLRIISSLRKSLSDKISSEQYDASESQLGDRLVESWANEGPTLKGAADAVVACVQVGLEDPELLLAIQDVLTESSERLRPLVLESARGTADAVEIAVSLEAALAALLPALMPEVLRLCRPQHNVKPANSSSRLSCASAATKAVEQGEMAISETLRNGIQVCIALDACSGSLLDYPGWCVC